MATVHHLARAVGSFSASSPEYQIDIRVGRHRMIADELPSEGGTDAGPSPFGLLLSGLAACTAITLRMYAARKGWELAGVEVDVRYDVDEEQHASIQRTVTLPADLPEDRRQRLAEIAERTPVTRAIKAGTEMTTTVKPQPA